jgi:hypothetical protein
MFLFRVEGEQGYVARLRFGNLAADNGTFLVRGQVSHF